MADGMVVRDRRRKPAIFVLGGVIFLLLLLLLSLSLSLL
ncbi:hypothetical protein LG3211_3869 [Lysobacter gummosus]|nr:hypothetical protein LG3211_3869 [Lysobacter gummosus]